MAKQIEAGNSARISLQVQKMNGDVIANISALPSWKVIDVKKQITRADGTPWKEQKLLAGDLELTPDLATISELLPNTTSANITLVITPNFLGITGWGAVVGGLAQLDEETRRAAVEQAQMAKETRESTRQTESDLGDAASPERVKETPKGDVNVLLRVRKLNGDTYDVAALPSWKVIDVKYHLTRMDGTPWKHQKLLLGEVELTQDHSTIGDVLPNLTTADITLVVRSPAGWGRIVDKVREGTLAKELQAGLKEQELEQEKLQKEKLLATYL